MVSILRTNDTSSITRYGSRYYDRSYWLTKYLSVKDGPDYGMNQFHAESYKRNILRSDEGKYLVSPTGHRILNPYQQPTTKSVTVEVVTGDESSPPKSPVTSSPTPSSTTSNGEGLVDASEPIQHKVDTVHHDNNTVPMEVTLRPATQLLTPKQHYRLAMHYKRRYEDYAALSRKCGLKSQQARDYHAIWHKYIYHKKLATTPKPNTDTTKAIATCEQSLRAMLKAFFRGDMDKATEYLSYADQDINRMCGRDEIRRMWVADMIESILVKPEIIIPDSVEYPLTTVKQTALPLQEAS